MDRRLYALAGSVVVASALAMGGVAYLQGDFQPEAQQTTTEETKATVISLANETATTTSDAVTVEGNTVIITKGGKYEVTGQANSVNISVSADVSDDVTLTMNNAQFASLTLSSTGTNIVELTENSENRLSTANAGLTANNVTLRGKGKLTVSGTQYGMFVTEDLVIESGTLAVESAGSGLYAKDDADANHGNLTINGGEITVTAGQTEGTAALFAGNHLTVNNGTITVQTAYEALVGKHVLINGGVANVTATDDGLVARDPFYQEGTVSEADMTINGGSTTVVAGASGIAANGNLTLAGGTNAFVSTNAEALVLNATGTVQLTGGILWAFGGAVFSSAEQSILNAQVAGNAGDTLTLQSASGEEVATVTAPAAFTSVTYSATNIVAGQNYTLATSSGNSANVTAVAGQTN